MKAADKHQEQNYPFHIPQFVLVNSCRRVYLPREYILTKGDEARYVHILLEGSVNIVNQFDTGDHYCFAHTKALDYLGEIEFLANKSHYASTCIAETTCNTLQIPCNVVNQWIDTDPAFLRLITTAMTEKSYYASDLRGIELFYPSTILTALYIVRNIGVSGIGDFSTEQEMRVLQVRRQEISDEISLSVRSVNRAIGHLKQKDLIQICKGKVALNRKQYKELCRFADYHV